MPPGRRKHVCIQVHTAHTFLCSIGYVTDSVSHAWFPHRNGWMSIHRYNKEEFIDLL